MLRGAYGFRSADTSSSTSNGGQSLEDVQNQLATKLESLTLDAATPKVTPKLAHLTVRDGKPVLVDPDTVPVMKLAPAPRVATCELTFAGKVGVARDHTPDSFKANKQIYRTHTLQIQALANNSFAVAKALSISQCIGGYTYRIDDYISSFSCQDIAEEASCIVLEHIDDLEKAYATSYHDFEKICHDLMSLILNASSRVIARRRR
jgi:hypothetical protein